MTYKEAIKKIESITNEVPEIDLGNYTSQEIEDTVKMTNDIWQILQESTE